MSELVDFAKRVEEQLTRANREPHWEPDDAERYMAEVSVRRERFGQLAMRLNDTVIQPRLETLASYRPVEDCERRPFVLRAVSANSESPRKLTYRPVAASVRARDDDRNVVGADFLNRNLQSGCIQIKVF